MSYRVLSFTISNSVDERATVRPLFVLDTTSHMPEIDGVYEMMALYDFVVPLPSNTRSATFYLHAFYLHAIRTSLPSVTSWLRTLRNTLASGVDIRKN